MNDYFLKLRVRFSVECEGVEQHARTLQVDERIDEHQLEEERRQGSFGASEMLRYRLEHAAHTITMATDSALRGDDELMQALMKASADALARAEYERNR